MADGYERRDDMTCKQRGSARPGSDAPECGGPLSLTRRMDEATKKFKAVIACDRCGNVVEGHPLLAGADAAQPPPGDNSIPRQDFAASVPDRVNELEKALADLRGKLDAQSGRLEALEAAATAPRHDEASGKPEAGRHEAHEPHDPHEAQRQPPQQPQRPKPPAGGPGAARPKKE